MYFWVTSNRRKCGKYLRSVSHDHGSFHLQATLKLETPPLDLGVSKNIHIGGNNRNDWMVESWD